MRTKNFNLKKKIAFIASVAMIASTAAYLPAGSFTASAAELTAASGAMIGAANEIAAFATPAANIDTFAALVKINGKYLAKNTAGDYKLFANRAAVKSAAFQEIDVSGLDAWTDKHDADNNYDELVVKKAGKVLAIPYVEAAEPTVTLEFVARKKAQLDAASATEIEVKLDKYGKGVIADNTDPVIGYSDTSNWKSKNTLEDCDEGSYEMVDYSGLRVVMLAKSKFNAESIDQTGNGAAQKSKNIAVKSADGETIYAATMVNVDNYEDTSNNNDALFNKKVKDIKPNTYATVAEGGVNANILTAAIDATLEPGTPLKIETQFLPGWTITGSGYNSTDKTLTVQMGANGYAESGIVKAVKGDKKEYFKYVVKNGDTSLGNDAQYVEFFGLCALTDDSNKALSSATGYADRFKIEHETKSMTVPGKGKQYVEVYTVYNNESDTEYIDGNKTITLKSNNGKNLEDVDGLSNTDNNKGKTLVYDKPSAGTLETGILKYITTEAAEDNPDTPEDDPVAEVAKYFQIKFTNEYEVEYDTWNATKKEIESEAINTKTVKVTGRTIEKPEDPDLSSVGEKYVSWNDAKIVEGQEVAGNNLVFAASNGSTQIEQGKAVITPNMRLKLVTDELLFNVKLDANGGYIKESTKEPTNKGAKTSYAMYNGTNSPVESTFSNTVISKEADWTARTQAYGDIAYKCGYTFLGWSTNKDATKAMTAKEIKEAFPGSSKTLTLYAVYKAQSEDVIKFYNLGFDETTGASAATDYKKSEVEAIAAAYGTDDADFASASDKIKMFKPGQALGELPTPVKSGYEFEGWYVKKIDPATQNVSGVKVTADTIADESIFNTVDGKIAEAQVGLTLYAKFVQKSYKITFETGEGSWNVVDYEKDGMPVAYKFKGDNIAVVLANGKEVDSSDIALEEPTIGSNLFTKFDGWKINGGTSKITSGNFWKALKNLDTAADITAVAVYKDQQQASANISVDANGGAFYFMDGYDNKDKKATSYLLTADQKDAKTIAKQSLTDSPEAVVANKYKVDTKGNIVLVTEQAITKDAAAADNSTEHYADAAGEAYKIYGYTVARPGYTFTGWYSDKECTKPYTFNKIPKKGVEDVVYAGWKVSTATKWQLVFDLQTKDGEIITWNKDMTLVKASTTGDSKTVTGEFGNPHDLQFVKTYNGTAGEDCDASTKTIELGDKKYVFSKKLSADLKTTDKVEAEFKFKEDTTNDGLNKGDFIIDNAKYTVVEGIYVEEGSEVDNELGTATNVKVNNGTVTFTAAANADHYRVQKTYTVDGKEKVAYGSKFTTTTGTYKVPVGDYKIAVVAYKDAEETEKTVSAAVSAKGKTEVALAAPTGVTVENGAVTFTASANADHYRIQKTVNGKTYRGAKLTSTVGTYSVPAEAHSIQVVAFNADETQEAASAAVAVAAKQIDLVAVDDSTIKVTVDPETGKGTVTWDAASGAKDYKVFKIVKEKDKKTGKVVEKTYNGGWTNGATSYTFVNLPTTDYKVYVAAKDAKGTETGNVKYSAKKKISTLPVVTGVKISADKKTVSWTAPTGTNADKIVKYQVAKFDTTANKTAYSVKADAPATSITMKNAAVAGTKIFVLAFDAEGNSSYSASITVE